MKFLWLVVSLLVLCSWHLSSAAKKKKSKTSETTTASSSNANKIDLLANALKAGPLLSLSDRNFSKFITDRPREYYSVLVLTATDPKYGCSVCSKGRANLEEVARLYHSQYNISEVPVDQRVLFFKAEVDDARNIFGELRIETVPRTYILPPADTKSKKIPIQEHEVEGRGFMESLQASVDAVNQATGVKIQILQDPFLFLFGISIFAVLLALFVSAAIYDIFGSLLWYQTPKLWVIVSVVSTMIRPCIANASVTFF